MSVMAFLDLDPLLRVGVRIIHTCVVSNNDTSGLGLVTVAVPWIGDVVARVAMPMAGPQRGFWFIPQKDDEVLVLLTEEPQMRAFVIGCLWTVRDKPPRSGPQAPSAQVIRTPGGQELAFEDQGTTVALSTKDKRQQLRMSSSGVELTVKSESGDVQITIGQSGQVEIKGNQISFQAQTSLSLSAPTIELKASGTCQIKGGIVTIN